MESNAPGITAKDTNRMVSLLTKKKQHLLSIFLTAGYPSLTSTIGLARSVEAGGADFMEIGVPFSDPLADGPDIQKSSQAAIENGMTVDLLLAQLREIRKTVHIPILLMGYLNPILQFGWNAFCREAAAAGADGLILPDLPVDEYETNYREAIEGSGLVPVFLISPTTSADRIRRIDAISKAFIYAVSDSTTTGSSRDFSSGQREYFGRLRSMNLVHPFLIGFGIGNAAQFRDACSYASGAIIGSAFVSAIREDTACAELFTRKLLEKMVNHPP